MEMALAQELLEQMMAYDDSVTMIQALSDYLELAQDDSYYYDLLLRLADLLGKRGYREFEISLLIQLWQTGENPETARAIAKAHFMVENDEACLQWLQVLDQPMTSQDQDLLGQVYYRQGQYDLAIGVYKKLIQESPSYGPAYHWMAKLQVVNGNPEKAMDFFQVILDYFAKDYDLHEIRLEMMDAMLAQELIQESVLRAFMGDSRFPPMTTLEEYLGAARLWQMVQDTDQAIEMAQKAKTLDQDHFEASLLLLDLASQADKLEIVQDELEWMGQVLPVYDPTILDLASLCLDLGITNQTIVEKANAFLPLAETTDDISKLIDLIVTYYRSTDKAKDLGDLLESLDEELPAELLIYPYAIYYQIIGDYDQAKAYLNDGIDLALPHESLVVDLVSLYLSEGDLASAKDLVQTYQNTLFDTPHLQVLRERMEELND